MVIIFGNYIQYGLLVVSFFKWNNCFTSGDMNDVSEKIIQFFSNFLSVPNLLTLMSLRSVLPLLEMKGFTIFQNCMLFIVPFSHFSLKWSFIACHLSFTDRFL